ncbi:mediator of RNA polymerase II transcription subunit 4 [Telopea speciosissima]|uniref:mediator of RNA polymerase II transcription subunit 4 n=1 Tax=Telopea speciosissima TaxID=54955 RepID=UPI001CC52B46|nr:mediator of RNA polymerase II transcription subunit 4 [Telopea speciosissima]
MQQNHQSPMLQSPARLGLTNPNSPSLSNPATPKLSSQTPQHQQHFVPHHQQQQQQPQQTPSTTASLTTTTTSSALLPLLPPLSRAQSILLQMASLATRLFEVSPNRSMWLSSYRGSLPTFLPSQNQFQHHDSSSSPSTTKEILSLFNALQTQLFEAVAQLQEILDLQDAKQKIASEIRSKDSAMRAFANKMKDAEHVLDLLVDDYADYRRPKRSKSTTTPAEGTAITESSSSASDTTITSSLRLSDIMSYAHRISYTTFAPPEFGAGVAPLRGAMPPAPQEEQMRASQLYNFADLDVGLPKTVESEKKAIETLIEAAPLQPPQPADANQLLDLTVIKGLFPPQLTVPSGWRPGMPVELPTDMPLVPPPGWKPGDPVPLPSLDSIVLPGNREEQQPRPVVPQMPPPKAPEPIQVRHVQLDINPDEDDASSDYSSDMGSSEEDDED